MLPPASLPDNFLHIRLTLIKQTPIYMKKIYTLLLVAAAAASYTQVQRAIPRNAQAEKQLLKKLETSVQKNNAGSSSSMSSKPSAGAWQALCGSMNVYGMLLSGQRPLQFNKALNAISFVHRKSDYYNESPALPSFAKSGVIVAEISSNGGASWDSTCIYSDANNWGRYPQGAIYSAPGNTLISNAQIIGTGVTVDNGGFSGSWYASKSINGYSASAGTITAQQQFFSFNQGPYTTTMPRHGWMCQGFTICDNGKIYAAGVQGQDLQGTSELTAYAVATGSFNGVAVDWSIETLVPPAIKKSDSVSLHITEPKLCFNAAGTIGYLVGSAALRTATLSNRCYQPIIYKIDKTSNANATWTLLPAFDFNVQFAEVAAHLEPTYLSAPVNGQSVAALPFLTEYDIAVDNYGRLHLAAVFCSGYSDHVDSLQYYGTFTTSINPAEAYRWKHTAGKRPYIYDFIGGADKPWKLVLVDSLSSETPGFVSGDPGYQENPWDEDGGQKIPVDARLQMSRNESGDVIVFSFTQSDTAFTNQQFKYNTLPDLHLRALHVFNPCNELLSQRINASSADINVRSRATLHYASPNFPSTNTGTNSASGTYTVHAKLPLTITNSNPYSQLTNNCTWFSNENLPFKFTVPGSECTGLEKLTEKLMNVEMYPNPAQNQVVLEFGNLVNEDVIISVIDISGKMVTKIAIKEAYGPKTINLTDVQKGLYFVSIQSKNGTISTKKLVIE